MSNAAQIPAAFSYLLHWLAEEFKATMENEKDVYTKFWEASSEMSSTGKAKSEN